MKKNWIQGLISGSILVVLLAILLLRPSVLVSPILEDPYIPMGNLIFSVAFIAFPVFLDMASRGFSLPYSGMKKNILTAFKVAVIFAVLWWPISYMLAGNFSNSFRNQAEFVGSAEAGRWFWGYSYFIVFFPIGLWFLRAVLALLGLFRKKS